MSDQSYVKGWVTELNGNNSNIFQMAAPCLLGLEGLAAGELRRMDAQNVTAENGRVFFEGDGSMLARANLNCRYAERIGIVMGRFEAVSFDELFEKTKALPWERWISKSDAFPVKGSSLNSRLHSVPDCQKIIKKAIVERLKAKYALNWFEETGALHRIQFLLMKDQVLLMIDTSGAGLHKRGYRPNGAVAPIKETLAAAMADIAFVRRDSHVIDPCCGSGTILIESAMKALNVAPGLRRSFAAEQWRQVSPDVWRSERERAKELINRDAQFSACGYDIDENVIELARRNAYQAGMSRRITFEKRDIADFTPDGERGVVVCNPPYGERLLTQEEARAIYQTMGKRFERRDGWSYAIITPEEEFEHFFGRKCDKQRKLYNGMLQCRLYLFFK
ncbi:MAG: class I SAM-dependent RNA methyltransferase [Clostridia bacterium]|nr:class I SAM-dependent RNA methyltransferase [Clostridia bacterium]MBQ1555597.1 class I SAM-dependent RNA methyltransferase [Clostridia bacterium]